MAQVTQQDAETGSRRFLGGSSLKKKIIIIPKTNMLRGKEKGGRVFQGRSTFRFMCL